MTTTTSATNTESRDNTSTEAIRLSAAIRRGAGY